MGKAIEKVMGVEIFKWDGWDIAGDDVYQFYEVEFLLPELQKYNGNIDCVTVDRQYDIGIYLTDSEEFIELNIGSLKSFRERLEKIWEN